MPHHNAIQFASSDVLQNIQDSGLQKTLSYISKRSRFYQHRLKSFEVDTSIIRSKEQLCLLPFTTKDDLQLHNDAFLCVPPHKVREYTTTSGTLGMPVSIALTEHDLNRLAQNECQSFQITGSKPGDVFQLALTLDRQFMAGIAYYGGVRLLGGTAIRTGAGLPGLQWNAIKKYQVDTLICVPSFLKKMLLWAQSCNFDTRQLCVNKVICIGESIYDADLKPNSLYASICNNINVNLFSTYASTEMQTAFTSCEAGSGCHHQPDLIIFEVVDDDGTPVAPGNAGEVVITTIGVEAMPLLRYRTGDICFWYNTPCSCGRTTSRLGPVIGRKQQLIKFKGTTLYPQTIANALADLPFVNDHVTQVSTLPDGTDDLLIMLSTELSTEKCRQLIIPFLQERLKVTPTINIVSAEILTQLQNPGDSRKPIRFIDGRTICL